MSFENDSLRWEDASQRILKLQQSTGDAYATNLNIILDNLNSLDYATTVVEKKEEALPVLSKCCALVAASRNDEFLVTKLCQLVVNLLSKQKVSLDQGTLNDILSFLLQSITTCKWTMLDLLRALGATLYESGSMCCKFAKSLLGTDGLLVRLCRDQMQDADVLRGAVQCIGNICMRSPNGSCLEDQFITNALDLLLTLLQDSPRHHQKEVDHLRFVNTVLRALQHVLVLGCTSQKHQLGPLLAALKNYMFCGMPGYKPVFAERSNQRADNKSAIQPDDLSSVHLDTIPQKDRTYTALSRKKRRTNNKKTTKQGPRPVIGSSSMDALTPAFAACNLTSASMEPMHNQKKLVSDDRQFGPNMGHQSAEGSNHSAQSSSCDNNDTRISNHEGSGTESSGYVSNSSLYTSSDSEYSDSDAGQKKQLRSVSSKLRLNVLICLQAVIKSADRKVLFGYWSSFVPDNTVASSWSLFTIILKDPNPKGRASAVESLMDLLDNSRQFLVAAGDREEHSSTTPARPYTSFSVKLSGIVHELHRRLLQAFLAETSATTRPQILKCLSILVLNSPYNRLKEGLLSKVVKQLRPILAQKDSNLQTAVLSCLKMVVCVHTPLPEVAELMRPPLTDANSGTKGVTLSSSSSPFCNNSTDSGCTLAVPDLAIPLDSPWMVTWCIQAANRQETSMVVRLESLQFLGSFVRSYVFLASSSVVSCLSSLACACLKDSDLALTLSAMKLLEELGRAMYTECTNTQTTRRTVSKEQLVEFWRKLLEGPLTSTLQGGDSMLGRLRCAAVDCLSNIGPIMFEELLLDKRILCITLLLGLSSDEDRNIKASAIRALGVLVLYPCLREDVLFVADTANAVLGAMADPNLNVRMKAAWALANLSDSLVVNMSSGDLRFTEDFSDMLLLKLLNTSITAAEDNEKVKSNAVRALGNFLRYIRASSLEKKGFVTGVEKAVQALVNSVGLGVMKVRWNACYAMGNVFRNPFLPIGTSSWTGDMFSALEEVIRDCKNFKVRINAVLALSVPLERRCYGDVTLYCHVYETLINALKSTDTVTEFSEFKYRDSLRQQLCSSLCHMTRLMTTEDAVCLGPVLEENHDIVRKNIRDYIRQLVNQETPIEDQGDEKTSIEKLNAVQEARKRVQEELGSSTPAVKILQDVFGEECENTEQADSGVVTQCS